MKLIRSRCLVCERKTNKYIFICDECFGNFQIVDGHLEKSFTFIDRGEACFLYDEFVSKLIYVFKFGNKRHLSYLFAEQLLEKIYNTKTHLEVDGIISVPIHEKTFIKRGYNQVELIEDILEKILNIPSFKDVLVKNKFTKEQARLGLGERRENLKNAFSIKNVEKIKGKSFILLDDMITTGSTMEECGKTLKENGAKKIIGISLATTP